MDLEKIKALAMLSFMRTLAERSIKVQRNIFTAFIDYEKAFDRVKHKEIINDLKSLHIDDKDLRLLQNLYWEQLANISIKIL